MRIALHNPDLTEAEDAVFFQRAMERLEMVKWVTQLADWELSFTGTFRWTSSLGAAQRAFERFMKRECEDVSYFYAVELHPLGHGYHLHSLWANTAGLYRRGMWERWFVRFGRNRLEPIRSRLDACCYLTKYVTKEMAWWNVQILPPGLPFEEGQAEGRPHRGRVSKRASSMGRSAKCVGIRSSNMAVPAPGAAAPEPVG